MKKFIVLVAVIIAVYKFYPHVLSPDLVKSLTNKGAFDESGNPQTIVFVADYCKQPCEDTIKHLNKKRIKFTTINISKDGNSMDLYKSYDGDRGFVPWTVTGYGHVKGSDLPQITSMLADSYGMSVLSRAEKSAIKGHFNGDDSPKLVMYSTKRCGYCVKARQYFSDNNIPYIERDIEKSRSAKNYYTTLQGAGTPLIYIGYRRIVGFNQKAVASAIQEFKL